jgi:hypothetical protein
LPSSQSLLFLLWHIILPLLLCLMLFFFLHILPLLPSFLLLILLDCYFSFSSSYFFLLQINSSLDFLHYNSFLNLYWDKAEEPLVWGADPRNKLTRFTRTRGHRDAATVSYGIHSVEY